MSTSIDKINGSPQRFVEYSPVEAQLQESQINPFDPTWGGYLPHGYDPEGLSHTSTVQPPTAMHVEEQKKAEQKAAFDARFIDQLFNGTLTSLPVQPATQKEALAVQKAKTFNQNPFKDTIVPYSHSVDPAIFSAISLAAPLTVARKEVPKAMAPFMQMNADIKPPLNDKPVLQSPSLKQKVADKASSLFHRFVDWISGVLGFRKDTKNDPIKRNAEAARDCLKRLNASLEKMRELVQTDLAVGPSADMELAVMFLLLIAAVKQHSENKRVQVSYVHGDLIENQKKLKECTDKYFEAARKQNGMKWLLKSTAVLGIAATGIAVAGISLTTALVIATLASGGVAAVMAAAMTIAGFFAISQCFSAALRGLTEGVKAGVDFKTNWHKGQMIELGAEREKCKYLNEQYVEEVEQAQKALIDLTKNLSRLSKGQYETTSTFVNN